MRNACSRAQGRRAFKPILRAALGPVHGSVVAFGMAVELAGLAPRPGEQALEVAVEVLLQQDFVADRAGHCFAAVQPPLAACVRTAGVEGFDVRFRHGLEPGSQ